jgi:hypothetical protein
MPAAIIKGTIGGQVQELFPMCTTAENGNHCSVPCKEIPCN